MLILLYKSLFLTKYPIYMRNMFTLRSTSYNSDTPYTYNYYLWPSVFFLLCRQSMERFSALNVFQRKIDCK